MPELLAALYHRVSTLDQDPSLAREELRSASAMRKARVVLDIEEKGSGARSDRPGLQEVLHHAQRGKINLVLCWKLDRFGRSVLDVLSNVKRLQSMGVTWVAVTQGLEVGPTGDPISGLLLGVLAAVAEFERELISERTRLGIKRRRDRGEIIGRRPLDLDVAQLRHLRSVGTSWSHLETMFGASEATLRRRLREKGVMN